MTCRDPLLLGVLSDEELTNYERNYRRHLALLPEIEREVREETEAYLRFVLGEMGHERRRRQTAGERPTLARFPAAWLADLKGRVSLVNLCAGWLGCDLRPSRNDSARARGSCPCGNTRRGFAVYEDHVHCYTCGVTGDAISVVMVGEGLSFPQAVERLAELTGTPLPDPLAALPGRTA